MVEEILNAQGAGCPPEYHNIPIEEGHKYRHHLPYLREMPFLRTRYDATTGLSPNNPRQQVSTLTSFCFINVFYYFLLFINFLFYVERTLAKKRNGSFH